MPTVSLSQCWCSLILTLTTSIGIWHGAGATTSWSSVVSLSCSCRISLCVQSNWDSGGWATGIIHFSWLEFSTVSITLIRQITVSLVIRNYLFRHPIEGRLTFRDISSVAIQTKRMHLLHRLYTKPIHQWNRTRSLFRKYHKTTFITTANTGGMSWWPWQASISFS